MLLLLDGSNLIHRVLRTDQLFLINSKGLRTGGIQGFIKSIHKLCRESRFNILPIVCWDEGAIKFRQSIYSGYKDHKKTENRDDVKATEFIEPNQDEEEFLRTLVWTKRMLHSSILPLLGVPSVMVPGTEADDILAFMTYNINEPALVVTNDADLFQLINDRVKVYKPVTDKTYDKKRLIEEYELDPERYVEHFVMMKAMVAGEDGIPHVIEGIGPKTANKLALKIMKHEPLDLKKPKECAVSGKLEEIERNIKLMDLRYFQKYATEEVGAIRQGLSNCMLNSMQDEFTALAKLDALELNESKDCVSDLQQTGYTVRSRVLSLIRNNYEPIKS